MLFISPQKFFLFSRYLSFCLDFLLMYQNSLINGNVLFMVLSNFQKSGASQVCITFLQITQKIVTKDVFHWLELITEILSFVQIFSVRKTPSLLFWYFWNSVRISKKTKTTRLLAYFGPLKANYRYFMQLLTLHCFFLTLITVFSYV